VLITLDVECPWRANQTTRTVLSLLWLWLWRRRVRKHCILKRRRADNTAALCLSMPITYRRNPDTQHVDIVTRASPSQCDTLTGATIIAAAAASVSAAEQRMYDMLQGRGITRSSALKIAVQQHQQLLLDNVSLGPEGTKLLHSQGRCTAIFSAEEQTV
jgi:hypothetical protein